MKNALALRQSLRKLAVIGLLLSMSACARKQVTRAEWLQMSAHTFKNTTVEDVLQTGEKLLELCDGTDVTFAHSPTRMTADRSYMVYAVLAVSFGHYIFDFSATQQGEDVVTQLLISESVQAYSGMAPAAGGMVQGSPLSDRAAYDLFYSRAESLLHGSPWMTCSVAKDRFGTAAVYALCLNADDDVPPGVSLARLNRAKGQECDKDDDCTDGLTCTGVGRLDKLQRGPGPGACAATSR